MWRCAVGSRAWLVWLRLICLIGLSFAFLSPVVPQPAWAQHRGAVDDAVSPAAALSGDEFEDPILARHKAESFLVRMIRTSGIFGFLILMVSLAMAALIVTILAQLRRDNYLPAALIEQFEQKLNAKDYRGALEAAQASDSFLGRLLAAGMSRLRDGYEAAEAGMQEVGDDESLAMEQKIGYLSLIGTVGPMLGLLGTVQGMMTSFQIIAGSSTSLRPYQLFDGISTAMFTTLEGLIVALPAMTFVMVFKNRLARFSMEAGHIVDHLMGRFRSTGQESAPATTAARHSSDGFSLAS